MPGGVTMNQIVFQCDYNEPDMDPSVLYDVTFLIGTERVLEIGNLKEGDFPAELKETDFGGFQIDHEPNLGYGNNVCHIYSTTMYVISILPQCMSYLFYHNVCILNNFRRTNYT